VDNRRLPPAFRPSNLPGGEERPVVLPALRRRFGPGLGAPLVGGSPRPPRAHRRSPGPAQHQERLLVGALGLALLPKRPSGPEQRSGPGRRSADPLPGPLVPSAGDPVRLSTSGSGGAGLVRLPRRGLARRVSPTRNPVPGHLLHQLGGPL